MAAGVIIFIQLGKKKFVEKLDYLTSPGWLTGGDSRKKAGYRRGRSRGRRHQRLCHEAVDEMTKEMYLAEYFPGVKIPDILDNMGFSVDVSRAVEAEPPDRGRAEDTSGRYRPPAVDTVMEK